MFRNMKIGTKIALGFGVILVLLAVVGSLSYFGVGGIVRNAGQVIDGNKLDGMLAQKEVDHLNWVGKVNALLTDDSVTKLEVQTDDHKCGFGKWLYGDERKAAEGLVPSLAPLFKSIEQPHRHLHESAITSNRPIKSFHRFCSNAKSTISIGPQKSGTPLLREIKSLMCKPMARVAPWVNGSIPMRPKKPMQPAISSFVPYGTKWWPIIINCTNPLKPSNPCCNPDRCWRPKITSRTRPFRC